MSGERDVRETDRDRETDSRQRQRQTETDRDRTTRPRRPCAESEVVAFALYVGCQRVHSLTQEKHTQDDGTGVPEYTVRITEQLLLLRGVL